MIDESMGKVLGMAMAYGVSSLGLILAYYNYRKRVVKADKIFTGAAWTIIGATLCVIALAVCLVVMLARSASSPAITGEPPRLETVAVDQGTAVPVPRKAAGDTEPGPPVPTEAEVARSGPLPMVGVFLPAIVFLFSLWITWTLYKHFSKTMGIGVDH